MNSIKYHDITNDQLVRKLIVNTIVDLAEIPTDVYSPGSICRICDSSDVYILNVDYKWVRLPTTSSGGGTIDEDIIYDGATPLYWSGKA